MKKLAILLLTIIFGLTSCSTSGKNTSIEAQKAAVAQELALLETVNYDDEDLSVNVDETRVSQIHLNGDLITLEGGGATVDGNIVTIKTAGTYRISGTLNHGQILVDTLSKETIRLILDNANITNSNGAPIYIRNAKKTIITLADGTSNNVTDGAEYTLEKDSDEPSAAIFSKGNLTINGNGSLNVTANYKNGITSKDNLKIVSGTITVNAVNDGIRGRDYIAVKDGNITTNTGGDGLQSNNDEDPEKGYVLIEGGIFNITAGMDGIQAETRLLIDGGEINIVTAGGSGTKSEESAKGLKAGMDVVIAKGKVNLDCADDGIHSNDSITINRGEIQIASGDDAIHADTALTINDGEINITKSYEGLESAGITINDGNIHLIASDDGVNGSGGGGVNPQQGGNPGGPQGDGGGTPQGAGPRGDGATSTGNFTQGGQPPMGESGNYKLFINGGYLYVDAGGDGIDVNGLIEMTGGTVIVNGPTNNGNGPLDYDSSFNITGGYLIAVGSAGMAQAPSTSSTQYSLLYNFSAQQTTGTLIHLQDTKGNNVVTFMPTKTYQSIAFSSADLQNGATYTIFTGGSTTGNAADGLYTDGLYTAGTEVESITLSGITTTAGTQARGPGGGGPGPRGPGGPGGGMTPQPLQP